MHAKDAPKPSDAESRHDISRSVTFSAVVPMAGIGGMSPQTALALQRSIGNAAVSRLIEDSRHQHGAGCGHGQSTADAPAPPVQRSAVHDVLRSAGSPLDDSTRGDMESRLGADFSDVRVHDDGAARASAAEVGARAYTSGNHIVIGDGGGDRHTLAHELTHVIQQRQGPVAGTDNGSGLNVSDPSDRFEREAEANARRALSGSAPPAQRSVQRMTEETSSSSTPARPSLQRMEEETTSSSSSAPVTQGTAVATDQEFGIEVRTKSEAALHGLTKENTLVVDAGHSGDMYHIRAAMLLDPTLKLLMYGMLSDFSERDDKKRITDFLRNTRMAEENSDPVKVAQRGERTEALKQKLREIQIGAGAGIKEEGISAEVKKERKDQMKRDVDAAKTEAGQYDADLAREIDEAATAQINREREERPGKKRGLDRKASHMFQLSRDLGPGRIFYTKKGSGEDLGLQHGGGENLSTTKFKTGMLERNAWVGAEDGAAKMEGFYHDYAAPDGATERAFKDACADPDHLLSRFKKDVPYVIVNFRDSGHTGEGNAPALDTGRDGLAQIQDMIRQNPELGGAQPVPIGGYPSPATVEGPHLLEYWTWPETRDRRSQLALLRFLQENFTILGAVGMRSGVTDQFAFAGIKTLSIDISPYQSRPGADATGGVDNDTKVEDYPSKGWERGGKLEAIFGPQYGRAFLHEARENDREVPDLEWAGAFGGEDQAMIEDAIGHYFAPTRAAGRTVATDDEFRHRSHPLHAASREEFEESTTLGPDKKRAIRDRIAAQVKQDEEDRKFKNKV